MDATPVTKRLVFVIPTRNRASLAISAAQSILDQPDPAVQVLVSDNSTDPQDVDAVAAFCRDRGRHVHYVRPPRPLAMAKHWDWAMERARESPGATHVCYLIDRMILLPGELRPLLSAVAAWPEHVLVYSENRIEDHASPARLFLLRWTGGLWEIDSSDLLSRAASMLFHPLPRMMNCVVPLEIIERIRSRFGSTFASTAPDFCFTFRCLATERSIVYFDRAPILHYASHRSHGATLSRGETNRDTNDFASQLEGPRNACAPVPAVVTVCNAIVNEYLFVAREVERNCAGAPPFPPLDHDRYLQQLAREVAEIENPEVRARMAEALAAQGPFRRSIPLVRFAQRFLRLPVRLAPAAAWRWLFRQWRWYPPGDAPLLFPSGEEAMKQVRRGRRRRHRLRWHVHALAPRARALRAPEGAGDWEIS